MAYAPTGAKGIYIRYERIDKMDLICHLAVNKNCHNEGNLNL